MKNQENKKLCPSCNKYENIFIGEICFHCYENNQKSNKNESPLDKYEFEEDEYEKLEDDFIKKDIKDKNSDNMIVHLRPSTQRAIDKIIKVTKNKKI